MNDDVTICIPAYRAEAFLPATIESALAQTWPRTQVLVSVDAGGDLTADTAMRFAASGVDVVVQPRRLGWVGNVNAALERIRTRHAMILPHDDLLRPEYVAASMEMLDVNPDAVLAYSDLKFGAFRSMREPTIAGDVRARMKAFLLGHFDAVAFRGVFDRLRATKHGIPDFAISNYAADTLWIARMIAAGNMIRVPRLLYRKRVRPASVHAGWKGTTSQEKDEMWICHCLELERVIRDAVPWNEELEAAWRRRLLVSRNRRGRPRPTMLDAGLPLRPQAEAVYARVRERSPHYSWAA